MSSSNEWKKTEKKTADRFNTKRSPFSGSNSKLTASDSLQSRLFVECKTKEKHSVKTLYDSTKILADNEGKIPVVVLRENGSKDYLVVFEFKDLFKILREIDLSQVDKLIPKGTTIYKLLESEKLGNTDIYEIQMDLEKKLDLLFRETAISEKVRNQMKLISMLLFYVDQIKVYLENMSPNG